MIEEVTVSEEEEDEPSPHQSHSSIGGSSGVIHGKELSPLAG
jgi:hypothetical protein